MGRRRWESVPSDVKKVMGRVERWRETREKRGAMPEALWDQAAAVARRHGVWAVSRALRLNYECLKRRAARRKKDRAGGFVEVDAGALIGSGGWTGSEVELVGADGAKLTIRLRGGEPLDAVALAAAFWGRV